jgi:hypothetical protein
LVDAINRMRSEITIHIHNFSTIDSILGRTKGETFKKGETIH